MTKELFNKLDKYLEEKYPKQVKSSPNQCNHDFIELEIYDVCKKCALIKNLSKEVPEFIKNIDFSNKTFIPINSKNRNINRLHKWISYSYYEVRNYNMIKFIDELGLDREVTAVSKKIFIDEYNNLRTRGKIKLGLVAYSIFKASLLFKKDYDIDKILKLLDINYNHYNNAVNKLKEDKIFIPKDINKYYDLVSDYIEKNELIINYNNIKEKLDSYNSKTILIATIYLLLKKKNDLEKLGFMKYFKINIKTLNRLLKEIQENNINL